MSGRTIHVIYGEDSCAMARRLLEASDATGQIRADAHIVLKPNLAVARPAHEGATTHTEIVEGIVLHLKDCGVSNITIAEGSWIGDSTERAFRVIGLDKLAKKYGLTLLDLDTTEVAYLPLAQQYGAGRMEWKPEDIISLNQPSAPVEARADGRLVRELTRNVVQKSACSACFANLTRALYQYREQTGKNYPGLIAIGQEYQEESPDCLGIGRCCHGAKRHVPGCPPNAADILRALMK